MPDPDLKTKTKPELDPSTTPLPLSYWLMTGGGAGPRPSSWSSFLRLASERKAAYREGVVWSRRRAAARAEFEREWRAEAEEERRKKKNNNNNNNKPRRRDELMERFGPQGTERDRGDAGAGIWKGIWTERGRRGGESDNSGVNNSRNLNPEDGAPSGESAPGGNNNNNNSNNNERGGSSPPAANGGDMNADQPRGEEPGDMPAQEPNNNHDVNDGGDGGAGRASDD
ncbi:hypothetical protein F5X96DRAFT_395459 [Biscogniauxia mediterranea]|nr:hypothetical protein F5X96DRAFT_395459 [Biscogniauxia mediterranea]